MNRELKRDGDAEEESATKKGRQSVCVCMGEERLSFDVKRWQSLRVIRFASDKVFVIFMQFIVV